MISNDATMDHTTELIALEINLGLCMYTYNTSMTFGITTTDQIGEPTTLDWQFGQEIIGTTSVQIITATQDSDVFWMDTPNVQAFNNYLSPPYFHWQCANAYRRPRGGRKGFYHEFRACDRIEPLRQSFGHARLIEFTRQSYNF